MPSIHAFVLVCLATLRRTLWVLLLSVGSAFIAAAPAEAQSTNADLSTLRALYSGNGFLNRAMYPQAIEEYRKFLAAHPAHEQAPVARYGLAVALFRQDAFNAAASELQQLLQVKAFEFAAETRMMLGQCRAAMGDHAAAAEMFSEVLSQSQNHELADDAAALLAEANYHEGRYDKVAAPVDSLIAQWPDSPHRERAEFFRGLASMARGLHAEAAVQFRDLRNRFPEGEFAAQSTLLVAQCLHRTDAVDTAAEYYREIIKSSASTFMPEALYGLALILQAQQQPARAGELLDTLQKNYPDHALALPARQLRGRTHFDQQEYALAAASFEAVYKTSTDRRDEAAYWLAKCELRTDRPVQSATRLAQAINDFPESALQPEMHYDLAVSLMRCSKPSDAAGVLEQCRTAMKGHPLEPESLHLSAVATHQSDRFDVSAEHCADFIDRFPQHELAGECVFLLGENAFLAGRYQEAVLAYASYADRWREGQHAAEANYRLGLCNYYLRKFDDALPYLQSTLQAHPAKSSFRLGRFALADIAFAREQWDQAAAIMKDYLASSGSEDAPLPAADDALLKLGLANLRRGQPALAIASFDALLEQFPKSQHVLQAGFERGQALIALQQPLPAAEAFLSVVENAPESQFAPHALRHLGAIAAHDQKHEDAVRFYALVTVSKTATPPVVADAHFQRGQSLMALRRYSDAESAFASVSQGDAGSLHVPVAAAMRAIAIARQEQFELAISEIAAVKKAHTSSLNPSLLATLQYELAWCHRSLKQLAEAQAAYLALLDLQSGGNLRYYAMLEHSELQAETGLFAEAASRLEELRSLLAADEFAPPDLDVQASYRLGVCQFNLGRFDLASRLFDEFIESAGPRHELHASALMLAGESHFKSDRLREAVTHFTAAINATPDDDAVPAALLRLAESYAGLQQWDKSLASAQRYLDKHADQDQWFAAQFQVGWALEHQGELDKAMAAYRLVTDRHVGETAARAQFQIGQCLFAQQQHEEAARELIKVDILYAYPQWSAAALYEAGRCFRALNDPVAARKHLQQVVTEHPGTEWATLAQQQLTELARTTLPGHLPTIR